MTSISLKISLILLLKYFLFTEVALTLDQPRKPSRSIIESSNTPNLTVFPLPLQDLKRAKEEAEETNSTWRSKGFSATNVSDLASQYPSSFHLPSTGSSLSAPTNSSRLFHSSNETTSLTIVIKNFKHGLMYLNFSYYIGSVSEKPNTTNTSEDSKSSNSSSGELDLTSLALDNEGDKVTDNMDDSKEATTSKSVRKPVHKTNGNVSEHVIVHDLARRRRSITKVKRENPKRKEEPSSSTTHKPAAVNKSTIPPVKNATASEIAGNSITLERAVEMIKTAAAALTKEAVGSHNAGHTDPSHKGVGNFSSVSETGKHASNEKNVSDNSSVDDDNSGVKELSAEIITNAFHHHHHHKSSSSASSATSTSKIGNKGKGKNKISKNDDNVERISGKKNDNDKTEKEKKESSSSSSSSEEGEEEISEQAGGKKKISYKTWKASFEKKNRPPGLYVTINDDIIFDNWEGLWDKLHVLGRWTGTNQKSLPTGAWNHTQLFINFEDVPSTDVKISFEWEPINASSYIILADILVSTIKTSTSCDEPKTDSQVDSANISTKAEQKNKTVTLESLPSDIIPPPAIHKKDEEHHDSPIFVIKQKPGAQGEEAWQIIKMEKAGSTELERANFKEISSKTVASSTQTVQTKLADEAATDNLIKVVLKTLQNSKNGANSAVEASSIKLGNANANTPDPGSSVSSSPLSDDVTSNSVASISSAVPPPLRSKTVISEDPVTVTSISLSPKVASANNSNSTTLPQKQTNTVSEKEQKKIRQRNEDGESALLVSIVTGSIGMTIIVLMIKKYVAKSNKNVQQNQSR